MLYMKGIEKITEKIIQNTQQEIEEIQREAQLKAEEIAARYAEAAQKEVDEILCRGQIAAEERMERLAAVAVLDARKLELAAKQEILNQAFEMALDQLNHLPEEEYIVLLGKLAATASRNGKEEIVLSLEDRTRIGERVVRAANEQIQGGGNLSLASEPMSMKGGMMLRYEDIEINCTFESLIRRIKSQMSAELAGILFE